MSKASTASSQVISLPKGGGSQHGIGEKFSPDLHTGTGNFTLPLEVPQGRNGFQPQLSLVYSTGSGNGPFGLGWSVSVPGVSRQTSKGVPQYDDEQDVFVLSGAEDLVPVPGAPSGATCYRPRTEGLFAQIYHHHGHTADTNNDYWEVRSKDGLVSYYGTPNNSGSDPAAVADPADRTRVFAWRLTQTVDPFQNRIEYEYLRDTGEDASHHWDQLYLKQIRYADYAGDNETMFLVSVSFEYEDRPDYLDPFSEYRPGFEIRTRKRCARIEIHTHAEEDLPVRTYHLDYLDQQAGLEHRLPRNGASLLCRIRIVGHGWERSEELPPVEFGYTLFEPEGRDFLPIEGPDIPAHSLANADLELVDLFGHGLPDLLEINGTVRYWRNLGRGRLDLPREMRMAPAGVRLTDPGVQLIDANGDGRTDLLVTTNGMAGYYPMEFGGLWDRRSFQPYRLAPSFDLKDPEVRMVDLDGDGVTDAIRSGSRFECFFNDPKEGWYETRRVERRALESFPNVPFSDPRVKWADLTGDGLQDIILIHDGNVEYWPALGRGLWGKRISMRNSPRFPYGYDPRRILVGDVDGDGLADVVYVADSKVTLWINRSGNGWSDPIEITGTPPLSDPDAVRLADMLGTGVAGVLWTADASVLARTSIFFLDFTGGTKPYLLNEMDNRMGAVTRVGYAPSTRFYLEDQKRSDTRWKTPLPFPVQVVARVEVIDNLSGGKLTTEFSYHHGYWDGAEREFRGFGRVDQRDTEVFVDFHAEGLHPQGQAFTEVPVHEYSPPTETRTWFHQGPIGGEFGEWRETDFSGEFWAGDPQVLARPPEMIGFLKGLSRRVKRDALRTLRGSTLRTELYALDGTEHQHKPYTVTEHLYGVREETPPATGEEDRLHIFFPHPLAQRTTQWERGTEPMTQFSFTGDYDQYGQAGLQMSIAVPRWRGLDFGEVTANHAIPAGGPTEPTHYLSTFTRSEYAYRDDPDRYMVDRVVMSTAYEWPGDNTGQTWARKSVAAVKDAIKGGNDGPTGAIISQTRNFYDGAAFEGLPAGALGDYGALVRTESLVLTQDIVHQAYKSGSTQVVPAEMPPYLALGAPLAWTGEYPLEFRNGLPASTGYVLHPVGSDGDSAPAAFVATNLRCYDFQDAAASTQRGLIVRQRDPLGRETTETTIVYDKYALLPTTVTDPAGLVTQASYDYRVLQPREVVDPNGNRTAFSFTPLGLVASTAIMGKSNETLGDTLALPGAQLVYDFLAFAERGQPISVRTIRRVHHASDTHVPLPQRDETIETVEYSDGFGRLLQTRTQADYVIFGDLTFGGGVLPAGQADQSATMAEVIGASNDDPDNPNVVVGGWQVYDNKGRVVEKYEPFFDQGWAYDPPEDAERGQKVTMFYDPRGQVIRTVNPDGSEQQVIYGVPADLDDPGRYEPTPWEAYTYDANDNAGRTHPDEVLAYQQHWNTPASAVVDALGRTVETVARNGPNPLTDWYTTRSTYDIRGNLLTVTDAVGRLAFSYLYDLSNRPLRIESIDAGVRRTVLDAMGNVVEQRDSKGALALHTYDVLNRPTRSWARDDGSSGMTMRERLEYGDGGNPQQVADERAANRAANRLGKLHRHYDEAGLLAVEAYDFKGNILEKVRQVISDGKVLSVFEPPPANWQVQAFRVSWQPPDGTSLEDYAGEMLDAADYRTATSYDALNRVRTMRYPEDTGGARKELFPLYNRAGALESVRLDGEVYVERIAYDAKGQRALIAYGNGVMTRYAYDPLTFRLRRLRTERYTPHALSYQPAGGVLQDFAYEYDLAGNIRRVEDRTPGCGVTNTPLGADALARLFTYDPLYRLLSATGRECKTIPRPRPWTDDGRCGFNGGNHGPPNQGNAPQLSATYQEEYAYDPAGNLVSLSHGSEGASWTRHFGMGGLTPQQWAQAWPDHMGAGELWPGPPNNRLTHVGDDDLGAPQTHFYDANGNLVRETISRHFEWDYGDRLRVYRTQPGNAEPSVHAQYLYGAGGQRVKKLVRKQGGQFEVTVYIDGIFEHHRFVQGGMMQENNTLHVMDNQSRIALVRVGNAFPGDATPAVKYHMGDHLGSSSVVIGDTGGFINREEYTPYGETSFGSFARKRYRFTGKERDEESGLYYHGARYYAPWLGRWMSCDPMGIVGGLNVYSYVSSNPVRLIDSKGTHEELISPLAQHHDDPNLNNVSGPPPPPVQDEDPPEDQYDGPSFVSDPDREPGASVNEAGGEDWENLQSTGGGGGPLEGQRAARGAYYKQAEREELDSMIRETADEVLTPRNEDTLITVMSTAMNAFPTPKLVSVGLRTEGTATIGAKGIADKLAMAAGTGGIHEMHLRKNAIAAYVEGGERVAATISPGIYKTLREAGVEKMLGVKLLEPKPKRLSISLGTPIKDTVHAEDILHEYLINTRGAAAAQATGELASSPMRICDECSMLWELIPGATQVNPKTPR